MALLCFRCKTRRRPIMSKIVVRIPEPKDEYDPSTQRQINRTLSNVIDQLNSTYQQSVRDDQQQQAWFLG